jgi:hypothetical protein
MTANNSRAPFPRLTVESLRDGEVQIIARADVSQRRAVIFALVDSSTVVMSTVERAGDEITRVCSVTHFAVGRMEDLDRAIFVAKRALESASSDPR